MKNLTTQLQQNLINAKERHKTAKENGDIVQTVLIIAIFVIMVLVTGNMLYSAIKKQTIKVAEAIDSTSSPTSSAGASSTTPPATGIPSSVPSAEALQTKSPISVPTTPAPEFPWSMVLGGIFSVVIAIIAIAVIVFFVRKALAAKQHNGELRLDWTKLIARHESVRKAWSVYELDLVKILSAPLMSDMRNPLTVALHTALRNADAAEPKVIPSTSHKPANGSRYEAAVIALEEAFQQAEVESQRVKWSNYSMDEKKRLKKAQDLLNLAMNDGATEFERQAAYKALRKELDGLLVIPAKAVVAIETKVRLMVES